MNCNAALDGIRDRLRAGEKPQDVIASLVPPTMAEAEAWGRRLPLWAEFAPEYGEQVVALARVVSKRGLRLHRRTLDHEGHVVPGSHYSMYKPPPGKRVAFTVEVDGVPVRVEYIRQYIRDRDHFQFTGPGDPPEAIPFTGSAHWSHFTASDVVAGAGGPEAFVRAYIAAGPERDKLFRVAFEGEFPETAAKAVRGKHTAKAAERKTRAVPPPASPPPPPEEKPGGTPSLF